MLRTAALLLAGFFCAGIGFLKSASLSGRVRDLNALRKILRFLKGEISFASTTIPDAFWKIGARMDDPYRDFLQDLSEDLGRMDGETFSEIFSKNVDCHLKETSLTPEDKKELKEFGAGMGYLDRSMQIANLEHYDTCLKHKTEELMNGLPTKKKLFQSLGVMGGLFLVLLFW